MMPKEQLRQDMWKPAADADPIGVAKSSEERPAGATACWPKTWTQDSFRMLFLSHCRAKRSYAIKKIKTAFRQIVIAQRECGVT